MAPSIVGSIIGAAALVIVAIVGASVAFGKVWATGIANQRDIGDIRTQLNRIERILDRTSIMWVKDDGKRNGDPV